MADKPEALKDQMRATLTWEVTRMDGTHFTKSVVAYSGLDRMQVNQLEAMHIMHLKRLQEAGEAYLEDQPENAWFKDWKAKIQQTKK